jgi:NADH dehydrogenase (ubiquinone) 1 alpha/beta subcomplex 1
MSFIRLAARRIAIPRYTPNVSRFTNLLPPRAAFSAAAGLSQDEIQTRVLDVVKGFEKVDPAKVSYRFYIFFLFDNK